MRQECDSFKVKKLGDVPWKINELIESGFRVVTMELVRMTEIWRVIVVVEAEEMDGDKLWKVTRELDDVDRYK